MTTLLPLSFGGIEDMKTLQDALPETRWRPLVITIYIKPPTGWQAGAECIIVMDKSVCYNICTGKHGNSLCFRPKYGRCVLHSDSTNGTILRCFAFPVHPFLIGHPNCQPAARPVAAEGLIGFVGHRSATLHGSSAKADTLTSSRPGGPIASRRC